MMLPVFFQSATFQMEDDYKILLTPSSGKFFFGGGEGQRDSEESGIVCGFCGCHRRVCKLFSQKKNGEKITNGIRSFGRVDGKKGNCFSSMAGVRAPDKVSSPNLLALSSGIVINPRQPIISQDLAETH